VIADFALELFTEIEPPSGVDQDVSDGVVDAIPPFTA
jgi:hypothetical protein